MRSCMFRVNKNKKSQDTEAFLRGLFPVDLPMRFVIPTLSLCCGYLIIKIVRIARESCKNLFTFPCVYLLITTITELTIVPLSLKAPSSISINSGLKAWKSSYTFPDLVLIDAEAMDTIRPPVSKCSYIFNMCFTSCDFENGGLAMILSNQFLFSQLSKKSHWYIFIFFSLLKVHCQSQVSFIHPLTSYLSFRNFMFSTSTSTHTIWWYVFSSITSTIAPRHADGSNTLSVSLIQANSTSLFASSGGV